MGKIGAGNAIYGMQKRIRNLRSELESLGDHEPSPELIDSANLLRSNEHLEAKSQKQSELADAYAEYARILETMLSSVFEIQAGLGEVLREQSEMLSRQRARPRTKPAPKKPVRKTKAGRRTKKTAGS